MDSSPPSLPAVAPHPAKAGLNVLAALGLTALAAWLFAADLLHPGDPIFQLSWSLPALALFLAGLGTAALALAIFPKRFVIGANVLLVSRGALGFPLNVWMDNAAASRIVSAGLLALALCYLACSVQRLLRVGHRPWFRAGHSLALFFGGIALAVLALPLTVLGYTHAGRNLIGDYLRISTKAVSLVERVFSKGEQRVHLVGMMHIGSGAYYEELQGRLASRPAGDRARRLILTEGVSDDGRILPEGFSTGETYARWAAMLGLDTQKSFRGLASSGERRERNRLHNAPGEPVHFENADIDVSELAPDHRRTLVTLLEFLDQSDPLQLMLSTPEGITGLEVEALLFDGLIGSRNEALMRRFEELSPGFSEIYIPWGAAHLPDLEKRLRALGYQPVDEVIRPIVTFW